MAEVSDPVILQELAVLHSYYERVVRPVQLKRIEEAIEKRRNKENGCDGDTAVCDNSQPALRSVDGVHVPVSRSVS